jgi:hypothetical protein
MNSEEEILVILAKPNARETLKRLKSKYTILHSISNRVVIIRADYTQYSEIPRIRGVEAIGRPEVDNEVLITLTEQEKLFVRAWVKRLRDQSKIRPGDGLSWDHEGFEPPDRK